MPAGTRSILAAAVGKIRVASKAHLTGWCAQGNITRGAHGVLAAAGFTGGVITKAGPVHAVLSRLAWRACAALAFTGGAAVVRPYRITHRARRARHTTTLHATGHADVIVAAAAGAGEGIAGAGTAHACLSGRARCVSATCAVSLRGAAVRSLEQARFTGFTGVAAGVDRTVIAGVGGAAPGGAGGCSASQTHAAHALFSLVARLTGQTGYAAHVIQQTRLALVLFATSLAGYLIAFTHAVHTRQSRRALFMVTALAISVGGTGVRPLGITLFTRLTVLTARQDVGRIAHTSVTATVAHGFIARAIAQHACLAQAAGRSVATRATSGEVAAVCADGITRGAVAALDAAMIHGTLHAFTALAAPGAGLRVALANASHAHLAAVAGVIQSAPAVTSGGAVVGTIGIAHQAHVSLTAAGQEGDQFTDVVVAAATGAGLGITNAQTVGATLAHTAFRLAHLPGGGVGAAGGRGGFLGAVPGQRPTPVVHGEVEAAGSRGTVDGFALVTHISWRVTIRIGVARQGSQRTSPRHHHAGKRQPYQRTASPTRATWP